MSDKLLLDASLPQCMCHAILAYFLYAVLIIHDKTPRQICICENLASNKILILVTVFPAGNGLGSSYIYTSQSVHYVLLLPHCLSLAYYDEGPAAAKLNEESLLSWLHNGHAKLYTHFIRQNTNWFRLHLNHDKDNKISLSVSL